MSSAAPAKEISVIIVAWNCREHLRRCLAALRSALAGFSAEIIVVDNASDDGAPALLCREFPEVHLIEMGYNAGFAAAVNRAAGLARGEFLWLLNPDTLPTAACISHLLDCLRRRPRAGAVGPRLLDAGGATDPRSARRCPTIGSDLAEKAGLRRLAQRMTRLPLQWEESRPVPCLSGAALCLRRAALPASPLLDERFFLYAEDVDLCRRLAAAGWETWYCGEAELTHIGGGSSAGQPAEAGIAAVVSMARLFEKYEGAGRAGLYRAGVSALSALKLALFAAAAPLSAPARRKLALHRRLIAALREEGRHA